MNTDLEYVLTQFGLEKNQARVYLNLLQLGKATASDIARASSMKRPTVYIQLQELNGLGLVDISKTKGRTFYRAASPSRLMKLIDYKRQLVEDALPLFTTLYHDETLKPKVQTFEGKHALEYIYRDLFKELKHGEEVLIFGTVMHGEKEYRDAMELWLSTLRRKKVRTREIVNCDEFNMEYVQRATQNPLQQIRSVSDNSFMSDNFIYANTMAMFSVKDTLYVTLIQDENIVNSYRKLFELAWSSAEVQTQ